jgi:uncharacterized protein (TIGR02147 family)
MAVDQKYQRKSVFDFIDYRLYLENYCQEQIRTNRNLTDQSLSKRLGQRSSAFIHALINGKAQLSSAMTERFSLGLALKAKEKKYFTALVLFNQAKTAQKKQAYYGMLRSLGEGVKNHVLRVDQFDYFQRWYTPIVREVICLGNFQDNLELLGRCVEPPISTGEAGMALASLLKLDMIRRQKNGRYVQTKQAIVADDAIVSMALRTYQESALEHAKRAMYNLDRRERHISTVTMGISSEAYAAIAEEIKAFRSRVKGLVHQDKHSDRVYQFTMALFPVSKNALQMES